MSKDEVRGTCTVLYGGSFDPPHCAHVMVVSYLLTCTDATDVWVIPCFEHALGKKHPVPFDARMAMCKLAFAPFGSAVSVIDVEARLPKPSYSVDTVRHLVATHPERTFRFAVGSDIVNERHLWKDFDDIVKLAPLVVLARQGVPFESPPLTPLFPDVSATAIRNDLVHGRDVSDRVPRDVLALIQRNGWYADQ